MKQLGCKLPDGKDLNPQSFEWMFNNDESTNHMLKWLCNSLSKENLLEEWEIEMYSMIIITINHHFLLFYLGMKIC